MTTESLWRSCVRDTKPITQKVSVPPKPSNSMSSSVNNMKRRIIFMVLIYFLLIIGDNKLSEKEREPLWKKFVKEVSNGFAIMLWVGSILCILTYIL